MGFLGEVRVPESELSVSIRKSYANLGPLDRGFRHRNSGSRQGY